MHHHNGRGTQALKACTNAEFGRHIAAVVAVQLSAHRQAPAYQDRKDKKSVQFAEYWTCRAASSLREQ
jgi:hypothetical protein